jgi:hypothetical protein
LVSCSFAPALVSTFALFLAMGALAPALPRYVHGPLGGDGLAVGFVMGAFFLATLLARPLAGRLGDERGRRPVMIGGAAVMAAATSGFLLASNVVTLAMLRFVQGAGEAAFYVGAATAATDRVPASRRRGGELLLRCRLWRARSRSTARGVGGSEFRIQRGVGNGGGIGGDCCAGCRLAARRSSSAPHGTEPRPPASCRPSSWLSPRARHSWLCRLRELHASLCRQFGVGSVCAPVWSLCRPHRARATRRGTDPRPARASHYGAGRSRHYGGRYGSHQRLAYCAGTMDGYGDLRPWECFLVPSAARARSRSGPEGDRATVVGTVVTFFDLGQGVGALILGSLVTRAGYTAPFVVGALAAVGALAVLSVHRRRDPSLWQPLR